MDSQLALLIILFCSLLLKGFWNAAYENNWSGARVRKFYAYVSVNVTMPLVVIFLYTRYSAYAGSIITNTAHFSPDYTVYFDLASFFVSYLLTILGLFLSLKLWPFAFAKRATFKTLLAVVIVIFIVELLTNFRLPKPLPNGNLI